jgi:hypothetical protein
LRAFHDFDPLDVEQVEVEARAAGDIDTVEKDLDVVHVTEHVVLRQTADRRDRKVLADHRVEHEAGGQRGDVAQIANAGGFDVCSGEGGDGNRHRLQILGGLARRDDDFLERVDALPLLGAGRQGRRNRRRHEHRHDSLDPGHGSSP